MLHKKRPQEKENMYEQKVVLVECVLSCFLVLLTQIPVSQGYFIL